MITSSLVPLKRMSLLMLAIDFYGWQAVIVLVLLVWALLIAAIILAYKRAGEAGIFREAPPVKRKQTHLRRVK